MSLHKLLAELPPPRLISNGSWSSLLSLCQADAKHNESTEINCNLLGHDAIEMKASMNSRTDGLGDTFQEV